MGRRVRLAYEFASPLLLILLGLAGVMGWVNLVARVVAGHL